MTNLKNLTIEQVAEIADRYGLAVNDPTVIANAKQADEIDGTPCISVATNKVTVCWATDSAGIYRADLLLDGYLSQVAFESNADARAHRRFCRDAYGD